VAARVASLFVVFERAEVSSVAGSLLLVKSTVSRRAKSLDVVVDDFRTRPLDGAPYPYLGRGIRP
jgi:Transposase, Mutator family